MELKKVEKVDKNLVEIEVQVGGEEFERALDIAYRQNVSKIAVPGFRKGKAPRKMIEKLYGEGIFFEDAINAAYPQAFHDAIHSTEYEPVDQPDISITEVSRDGFTFTAKVTVCPEVEVTDYIGLKGEKGEPNVTEELIDAEISRLQKRNARLESVDRPIKEGDIAVIDFEGFVDGVPFDGGKAEGFSLSIGSGQFIPGFEDQLIGAQAGDEKDIEVTFPEQYQASDLAGKPSVFKVKVLDVKESIEPELDDEFAKDVSEFDTLEELRNDIRRHIFENMQAAVDRRFEESILDSLIEKIDIEIPEVMVTSRIDRIIEDMAYRLAMQGATIDAYLQMTGMTEEQLREGYREGALRQIKIGLALDAIAKKEGFTVTDEEIEAEYAKLAEQYKMDVEVIKERLHEHALKKDMLTERALNLIKENAVVVAIANDEAEDKKETEIEEETEDKKEEKKKTKKDTAKKTTTTKKTTQKKVDIKE